MRSSAERVDPCLVAIAAKVSIRGREYRRGERVGFAWFGTDRTESSCDSLRLCPEGRFDVAEGNPSAAVAIAAPLPPPLGPTRAMHRFRLMRPPTMPGSEMSDGTVRSRGRGRAEHSPWADPACTCQGEHVLQDGP